MDSLLTAKDLASVLRYTESSVYNLASTRPHSLPPALRLGKSLRWHPDVVDAWLRGKAGLLSSTPSASECLPVKKKRGRPTKGEVAAKAALKAAGGGK
ncbi:MAG: helix-turn-helix transcriptional regulator [Leptospirales bacterium]